MRYALFAVIAAVLLWPSNLWPFQPWRRTSISVAVETAIGVAAGSALIARVIDLVR